MAVFNTERGPEFFIFSAGDRNCFLVCKGGPVFYDGQRGGPEKIGDISSQIDGPLLIKNESSSHGKWVFLMMKMAMIKHGT